MERPDPLFFILAILLRNYDPNIPEKEYNWEEDDEDDTEFYDKPWIADEAAVLIDSSVPFYRGDDIYECFSFVTDPFNCRDKYSLNRFNSRRTSCYIKAYSPAVDLFFYGIRIREQ